MYLLSVFLNATFALDFWFPEQGGEKELGVKYSHIAANEANESHIVEIVNLINDYLWFFVGLVCLVLLAYSGYKIITAQGDKKQISDAYNLIIATIIAILVAVLSYAIVKLLVNLF